MNFSCAFPNTPKYTQVKQTGKGHIVNKAWILDCYKKGQLLSEKDYELKGSSVNNTTKEKPNRPSERKSNKPTTFDDDSEEDNERRQSSKDVKRKSSVKKKMTTFDDDDDDDTEEEPLVSKDVERKPQIKKKMATFDDEDDDEDEPSPVSKNVKKKTTNNNDVDGKMILLILGTVYYNFLKTNSFIIQLSIPYYHRRTNPIVIFPFESTLY